MSKSTAKANPKNKDGGDKNRGSEPGQEQKSTRHDRQNRGARYEGQGQEPGPHASRRQGSYLGYVLDHGVTGAAARDLVGITISVIALSVVVHRGTAQPLLSRYERSLDDDEPLPATG